MLRTALFIAAAACLAACNTYDPNLGSSPFRCGSGDPVCPDGYSCVEYTPTDRVCEKDGEDRPDAGPERPDADTGAFVCQDDRIVEPNDSLGDPTITPIPSLQDQFRLVGLAICPEGDDDFFRFDVDVNGKDGLVQVEYLAERGTLVVDVLDDIGGFISQATPVDGDPNVLRATIPSMPAGSYYVHIAGEDDPVKNNYTIDISVID